jgi:hypothetical protein
MQGKFGGYGRDSCHDLVAIQVNPLQIPVDTRAVLLVKRERVFVQDFQADVFQNPHRGIVNHIQ